MIWGAPLPHKVADPAVVLPLLKRAIAASPDSAALHAKLGYLHLDRFDFAAAAACFEAALARDPAADVRHSLARCYNMLHRPAEALALLAPGPQPAYERGLALMKLGEEEAAERELAAILAVEPGHLAACRKLSRLLRKSGRIAELLGLCESLAARGQANAQLLYNWGWALALAGDLERARRLLFEPERVFAVELSAPAGFADIGAFNAALADEVSNNRHQISDFPQEEEANRGSRRVDNLFTGADPALVFTLLARLQDAVAAIRTPARDGFDPWPRARPAAARLRPWGLIQRGGDYEAQHLHPAGWLSGVYYVRIPRAISQARDGRGCIEFGPPDRLAEVLPDAAPTGRYVPREGLLLLSPSHYPHRTIPSGVEKDRISIAFDVVPDPAAAA